MAETLPPDFRGHTPVLAFKSKAPATGRVAGRERRVGESFQAARLGQAMRVRGPPIRAPSSLADTNDIGARLMALIARILFSMAHEQRLRTGASTPNALT